MGWPSSTQNRKPYYCLILAALSSLALVCGFKTPIASSASLSQGYVATDPLVTGTLVSLDSTHPNQVKAANSDRTDDLLGVVVAADSSLLSLSGSSGEVQVATTGLAAALVTNLNGDIRIGDKLTVSPIEGVGMKAIQSSKVLGVAQANFTASSPNAAKRDIKDRAGKTKTAAIGQIPVLVEVTYFVAGNGDQKTLLPSYVQDLVNAVAGKKVSLLRISLAAGLLLFALITVGMLIYGSVHSSIISIGRNPLSQSAIYRSLLSVVVISGAILLVTLGSIYLIISR